MKANTDNNQAQLLDEVPQDVVPQEGVPQEVVPQDVVPQDVVPQDVVPENVVPPESPQQDVVPPEDVVPEESPQPDVVSQESSVQDVVNQESPLQSVVPQKEKKPVDIYTLERLRLACLRLKLREQQEREEALKQKGRSSPGETTSELDVTEEQTPEEIERRLELSIASTISIHEEEKTAMSEHASYSSNDYLYAQGEVESVSSIDPMRAAIDDLMLVPDLSYLSLSDDTIVKPLSRIKSIASKLYQSQAESESDIESEGSGESSDSFGKVHIEEMDKASESVVFNDPPFEEPPIPIEAENKDLYEFFTGIQIDLRNSENIEKVEQRKSERIQIINDFLNTLILNVITGLDPQRYRRRQLDKNKLHNGLLHSVVKYWEVACLNEKLTQLIVDYFASIKNSRALNVLSDEERQSYRSRYLTALGNVAYEKKRFEMVNTRSREVICSAQLELNNSWYIALGTERRFELAVRRVLLRPDSEHESLKRLIDREMHTMTQIREEVSDKRYNLIVRNHNLAELKEQIQELDTGAVSLNDFLSLQTKVWNFEKKLEGRSSELKTVRRQYQKELHQQQHTQEKILALEDRLKLQDGLLAGMVEKKNSLKNQLHDAKIERKNIRAKINEMGFRGGILSMPALMYDYDRTLDVVRSKRDFIAGLKETVRSLNQRLDFLEAKGSQINLNSVIIV